MPRRPIAKNSDFVIATLRNSDPSDDKVRIPHKSTIGGDSSNEFDRSLRRCCHWVQDAELSRVLSVKGKCPGITLDEIVRKIEALGGTW